MTNEEWDRKTEFLLNRHVQFEVDMEKLKEAQKKTEQFLAQTAEMISNCASVMFEGFKITDAKIRESSKITDAKIREVAQEIQNLNAKVNRHLDEGHQSA